MPEFISTLPDNEVAWGAFKVVGVDDRGDYNDYDLDSLLSST